jgi:ATP-dependent helicase/nuclease subunit A
MGTTAAELDLTEQQRAALETSGTSIALSAGAGSGKTFVLTQRLLRHLAPGPRTATSGDALAEIVAITFTDRAAGEMRDRVRRACREQLQTCPADQEAAWLQLMRELHGARISTIHSFCDSLLRSHAVEAGLDPHFAQLDASQASTLRSEVVDDTLRILLANRDPDTKTVVEAFGLERAHAMCLELLEKFSAAQCNAWKSTSPEALVETWDRFADQHSAQMITQRVVQHPGTAHMLKTLGRHETSNPTMQARRATLLEELPRLASLNDPIERLRQVRQEARVQGGGTKKDWESPEVYDQIRDALGGFRKLTDDFLKRFEGRCDGEGSLRIAALGLSLLRVSQSIRAAYQQKKQSLARLDFDDLIGLARDLLCAPHRAELRRSVASGVKLLLVDEFQDTDPTQVDLVKALCDDQPQQEKLFLVGDYKQSIYRFRGADPSVFRQLRSTMPPRGRLSLTRNFRSQPAIIDFVNHLFRQAMGDDFEPLQAHSAQVTRTPAVEFLWALDEPPELADSTTVDRTTKPLETRTPEEGTTPQKVQSTDETPTPEKLTAADRRRREADFISRRIRQLLDEAAPIVRDTSGASGDETRDAVRPLKPGDVALLFRALSDVEYYETALRRYDLDYYLVGGHAFYAQQEIFDLLSLLQALASPCDEVSLAGALRSPFFSLNDETLFWLAQHGGNLSDGLAQAAQCEALSPEDRQRAIFASQTLVQLRNLKDRLPVAQLIHTALDLTGYDAVILAEFLGERKLANLRKLIEQARKFDRSGIFTLSDFIAQLAKFTASQPREPPASTQTESEDAVKLMTIHQSKGLEFPLVIVVDIDRKPRAPHHAVALSPKLGPLVSLPKEHVDAKAHSGMMFFNVEQAHQDDQERTRLLYVATTRARDYLILSAGLESISKTSHPWTSLLASRFDLETGEPLEFKASEGPAPEIRVTLHPPQTNRKPRDTHHTPGLSGVIRSIQDTGPSDETPAKSGRKSRGVTGGRPVVATSALIPPMVQSIEVQHAARRQFSFSRLSGALQAEERPPAASDESEDTFLPMSFARADDSMIHQHQRISEFGGDAAESRALGTLVHETLAEVDYARPGDVDSLVQRMAARSEENGERLVDEAQRLVRQFLSGPRAKELAQAQTVYHEMEFLLAWPPAKLHEQPPGMTTSPAVRSSPAARSKNPPSRDSRLPASKPPQRFIRGFIDCLYQDALGAWHVLDYKTNRVDATNLAEVAARYQTQMLLYGLAVQESINARPESMALHFLRTGDEVTFTLDEVSRARLFEDIQRAIQRCDQGGA